MSWIRSEASMNSSAAPVLTPEQVWSAHVRKAVLNFLKTAVVVDNDPGEKRPQQKIEDPLLPVVDSGLGDEIFNIAEPAKSEDSDKNVLEIRKISDTFSDEGVACAFVLPDENQDEAEIEQRVVRAAKTADILVMDWHLRDKTSSLTLKLLESIARSDLEENGRMRLICIYTGEPLDAHILNYAKQHLSVGGAEYNDLTDVADFLFCAQSKSSLVVLANKDDIAADALPIRLIDVFTRLADGLVPTFALAAVGAVRKNTHHMLTRFSRNLDSAYVANRLISNPPEDVAEMMRELLVAECDNALGFESVADTYLSKEAIDKWLQVRSASFVEQQYGKGKQVDSKLIGLLLQNGIEDKGVRDDAGGIISFSLEHRNKVSIMLAGNEVLSKQAEMDFSRLVVFKREAFGETKLLGSDNWMPSLTTGTLLKFTEGEAARYFLCLTPACDTLRLSRETPFVFLEAAQSQEHYSVIFKDEDESFRGLYFRDKHPTLATFSFLPDESTQRIRGTLYTQAGSKPSFIFSNSSGSHRFTWLGEIRYTRAASEMAKLAGNWMRIGVSDSEFLRLTEAKKFC